MTPPNPIRSLLLPILLLLSPALPAQINPEHVTIIRDSFGVPHIYGRTDADVAYGLAWANAEDNFHDMQLNMLMARGRLGEVKGKEGAIIDYVVQLLDIQAEITRRYPTEVTEPFKKVLEGYAQGVNAYIAANPKEVLRPGIGPVTPIDILCGYSMSLVLLQGAAWDMKSILEGHPGEPGPFSPQGGSNSFAINSRRSADGQVYLLNNSHQPLSGPMSWYEAHLVSEEGQNIHGGLFPGGVSIFAGANENLAWAHTVNLPDLTDVYRLTTRKAPGGRIEYRLDGQWKPLTQTKARMKAKVGPIRIAVTKAAYRSAHGPVLKAKDGQFYALRFPATMTIGAAEQWHRMNKARNYTEFRQALEWRGLPCMNIVYADRHDTLYYLSNALHPLRAPGFDYAHPLPGDTSANIWQSFRPLSDNIQVLCPDAGYIFNTNNTPYNSTHPDENPRRNPADTLLREYRHDNNRSLRFQELIARHPKLSYQQFKDIKYDHTYPDSMYILFLEKPLLLGGLDPAKYPDIAPEIQRLATWDRSGHTSSTTASLYLVAQNKMIEDAKEERYFFQRNTLPEADYVEAIRHAKRYLNRHFGSLEVPLGELQRHVRGEQDWPVHGLPDVLAAMHALPWKQGRIRSDVGDSYIQFIRFTEAGVEMETVQPYGASEHPDSPHYADQAPLYLTQKTKPMRLDKEWVLAHAKRTYHPGPNPKP